ncbi:MAG: hypothetical protein ACPL1A_06675 [Candidatus Kapaibacteriota bacterium]
MKFNIETNLIKELSNFFEVEADVFETSITWTIVNNGTGLSLILQLFNVLKTEQQTFENVINVQTLQGTFELHNCTDYFIFAPDEIFFWNKSNGRLNCLVVGKQATCSLYSNIDIDILQLEPQNLPTSVLLASTQLAIINNFDNFE